MGVSKTLSFRLFVLLMVVLAGVFAVYTLVNVRVQSSHLMDTVFLSANRTSDLIKRSTRYSMLLNRSDDVHQIIRMIGTEQGVDGIRIYNKKGEIMFSTIPGEEGTIVDMRAEACYVCHSSEKPIESLPYENRARIVTMSNGHRVLGLINPIRNEPDCSNADCHAHPSSKTVLGVLDVKMSLDQVDAHLAESERQMVVASVIFMLVIAGISGFFIWRVVRLPVRKLIQGTKEISSGHLDYRIDIRSEDEIGQLAHSFNQMTNELEKARDEITDWSNTLERKVEEKTEELKKVQSQVIQIEKMASLGKLAATVAHELNNPLEGMLTYLRLQVKRLKKGAMKPEDVEAILQDLNFVSEQTIRCGNIVKNLLLFSKKQVGEFAIEEINKIIGKSLGLVQHHFQIHSITLEQHLMDEDTTLVCDGQQLQQAFLALLVNSVEAMPEGGVLRVESKYLSGTDEIQVFISDTGVGVAEEDLPHLFEPFFSRKKNERGVGLGLSVVYGIVERHGGRIDVQTKTNRGTTFTITLPRNLSSFESKRIQEQTAPR